MSVGKDEGCNPLARYVANLPDKHAAILKAVEPLEQGPRNLDRSLGTELPLEACRRADSGAQRTHNMRNILSYRRQRRHSCFSRRGARIIGRHCSLFVGGKARVTVDGSKVGARLIWEQGWDPAGGSGRPSWPTRRPIGKRGLPESTSLAQLGGSLR